MTGPRLSLRIFLGRTLILGPGKADLLAAVRDTGSIAAACRSMGMSYKKAWYLIDTLNRAFATPLVEASKGGGEGGGAVLTPLGEDVLARYRSGEAKAVAAVRADIEELDRLVVEQL